MDNIFLGDGCALMTDGGQAFKKNIEFVPMSWFETPSVVHDGAGKIVYFENK